MSVNNEENFYKDEQKFYDDWPNKQYFYKQHYRQYEKRYFKRNRRRSRKNKGHNFVNLDSSFYEETQAEQTVPKTENIDDLLLTLKMEALYLEDSNDPIPRVSTPSKSICFHCEHDHKKPCCLYVYDKPEDLYLYSNFKYDLENTDEEVQPQNISKIPEAVSGNSTPHWFPQFSYCRPDFIESRLHWFQQYYYTQFEDMPNMRHHTNYNQEKQQICCNLQALFRRENRYYPHNFKHYSTFSQFQMAADQPIYL